jgi:hypothetical protein
MAGSHSEEDFSVYSTKDEVIDVYPLGGRLAMFASSKMPHEVMPTYGNRYAITIW